MRVGIVTKWFNRGQPIVGRYIRSAFDQLGHETFILAKPKKEKGPKPGALQRTDVWDQPGVTEASNFETPAEEYIEWARENQIDVVHCDQNYQFDELAGLRETGVKVIGRFVWEHFTEAHVEGARRAYDLVYSVTISERQRYRDFGLETPRVRWGIHPELLEVEIERIDDGLVRYVFPGGFIGHRKPLGPVVEAFAATSDPRLRLLVKAQVERGSLDDLMPTIEGDPRIDLLLADQPREQHMARIAANDVCLAPSRWEGLGLPLYEAMAWGMPTITNDNPPMNEVIEDGVNGLLVSATPDGTAKSGIPAYNPDLRSMTSAIESLADDDLRARLTEGALRSREKLDWGNTISDLGDLLDQLD